MVSVNPTGGNEPIKGYDSQPNNTENIDKKDKKGNIWEQYDDTEYGEKGTIDEHELIKVVQDNLPKTASIKADKDKFNEYLESLKDFIGEKWNEDTYNKMIEKLPLSNYCKLAKQQILDRIKKEFDEMREIAEGKKILGPPDFEIKE